MVLRWLERRARFPAEQLDWRLGFEVAPAGRLQFRAVPSASRVLEFHAAGVDVRFLYPRGAQVGAESDSAVRAKLLQALDSHLALFPNCDVARDIVVLRGRLLLQGPYVTLARVLDIVREWRTKDAPPAPAAWKTTLDARLNASVEWDGRDVTGGSVIPSLRKLGGVDILLEDAPDGGVAHFELAAKDAQLLPPGKHTLKALLNNLTQKAGAQWRIELGVIVLTPKAEEKPPRRQP
jgi:hypothetical protein